MRTAALLAACLALLLLIGPSGSAEVIQRGELRLSFRGRLVPKALPRDQLAPVRVSLAARISSTGAGPAPQLRTISIAINRHGRFDPGGLPLCQLREIQPASNADALRACRDSLVGQGRFSASVRFSEQVPFPSRGKLYAFNGRIHGHPAILAHVYGTAPVPTSFTVPFLIGRARGTYATVLRASFPQVAGDAGHITGITLHLGRGFRPRGRAHSYLSASCPLPRGVPVASFPFARGRFAFGSRTVTSTLTETCRARR